MLMQLAATAEESADLLFCVARKHGPFVLAISRRHAWCMETCIHFFICTAALAEATRGTYTCC